MTPGPKEPTAEELQRQLELIVDDLLRLFYEGIKIPTPSCPEGKFAFLSSGALMRLSFVQAVWYALFSWELSPIIRPW